jgi:hypothetical protein
MQLNPKLITQLIDCFRKKELEKENLMNLRFGQVCATIANVNKRRGRRYKATDFIKPIKPKKVQTNEEMAKSLENITRILGGTING